ncbi:MAG: 50S ribosomal protein L11 [Candidatus Aenigmatarchaeota archaeon]|nr:MAG: 50S ribosomal protein L11 [Candidatus Aenigmarchaeota archaeon]
MPVIEALVEGGKASAAPPLGPALGPAGVPIPKVIAAINEKTKDFVGMQVPVKIIVRDDKSFEITVGTPPVSAMIKKEAKLEKLSGKPKTERLADLAIEQVIKIAKNKLDGLNTRQARAAVKQVVGTCVSSGILVEGKDPKIVQKEIDAGAYDDKILKWKTELSTEELKRLDEEKKKLVEAAAKLHAEQRASGEAILKSLEGRPRHEIVAKMEEAKLPTDLINELVPATKKAESAAPAAPAAPAKK